MPRVGFVDKGYMTTAIVPSPGGNNDLPVPAHKVLSLFVSYSSKDLPAVRERCNILKLADIDVFLADESVVAGERLSEKIHRAIAACDKFILMWSKRADQSRWVHQEIGAAINLGKTIVAIVLDGTLCLRR
jgi:hypothetical protein